jgi:hypothetical protein
MTRPFMRFLFLLVAALGVAAVLRAQPEHHIATGFTRLQSELGSANLATGSTLVASQVEAVITSGGTDFAPDASAAEFTGKSFTLTPASGTPSGHAGGVGGFFYGLTQSYSPGPTTVLAYETNVWLTNTLKVGASQLPSHDGGHALNHSWIGAYGGENAATAAANAYARLDYLAHTHGVFIAAGMNNGYSTDLPQLLGQGYNLVSVGLSNGQHSAGFTTVAGTGRIKPDLVAPASVTSNATPMVASAALFLRATATASSLTNATDPRVLKALLLASASKHPFPGWAQTSTRPLDLRYGAGELNLYNAHRLLTAGRQPHSTTFTRPARGWDYATTTNNADGRRYFFDIPAGNTRSRFAAALVWNRAVNSSLTTSLPNLTLRLHSATGFTLGASLAESAGSVDNLEHLHFPALPPGRYALVVTSAFAFSQSDYALAWFTAPTVALATTSPAAVLRADTTPVTFTFTRSGGDLSLPLAVPLALGGTAVSETHYTPAPPASVTFAPGATTASFTVTPLPAADPLSLAITFHARPYTVWRAARFSPAQLADPLISGDSADPDADGLSNLLEYASAREPLTADSTLAAGVTSIIDGRLAFACTRANAITDLAFDVEWSADLATWSTGPGFVEPVGTTDHGNGTSTVTVRSVAPLTEAPRQFLRLRVTRR